MKHVDGGQLSAEEAARLRQDKLERLEYVYSLADEDGDGGLTLTEFLATVRRARGTTLAKDLRLQLQMYSMIEKAPGECAAALSAHFVGAAGTLPGWQPAARLTKRTCL